VRVEVGAVAEGERAERGTRRRRGDRGRGGDVVRVFDREERRGEASAPARSAGRGDVVANAIGERDQLGRNTVASTFASGATERDREDLRRAVVVVEQRSVAAR